MAALPKIPSVIRNKATGRFEPNPEYGQPLSSENVNDNSASNKVDTSKPVVRNPKTGRFQKNPNYQAPPRSYDQAYDSGSPNPQPQGQSKTSALAGYAAAYTTNIAAAIAKVGMGNQNRQATPYIMVVQALGRIAKQITTLTTAVQHQTIITALGFRNVIATMQGQNAATAAQNRKNQPVAQVRPATPNLSPNAQSHNPFDGPLSGIMKAAVGLGVLLAAVNDKFVQIGAQIVAFAEIGKKIFNTVKAITVNIYEGVLKAFRGIEAWFAADSPLAKALKSIWSGIETVGSFIKTTFLNVFDGVIKSISGMFNTIGGWLSKFKPSLALIEKGIEGLWYGLRVVGEVLSMILKPLRLLVSVVGKVFAWVPGLNLVLAMLSMKMKDFTDLFDEMYEAIKTVFSGDGLGGVVKAVAAFQKFCVRLFGRFIQDVLELLGFEETAKKLEEFLDNFSWEQVFSDIKKFFTETLPDTLQHWYDSAVGWLNDTIVKPITNMWKFISKTVTDTVDAVIKALSDGVDWVKTNIVDSIDKFANDTIKFFQELFTDPQKKLTELLTFDPVQIVSDWVNGAVDWIKESFKKGWQSMGESLLDFGSMISALQDDIKDAILSIFPDKTVMGFNPRKTVESVIGKSDKRPTVSPRLENVNRTSTIIGDREMTQMFDPNWKGGTTVNNTTVAPHTTNIAQTGGGARYGAPPTSYMEPSLLRTYGPTM